MSVNALEAQEVELVLGESGDVAARSPLQLFWRRFRRDRVAMTAMVFIVVLIVLAIAAPLLVKAFNLTGPNQQNIGALDSFGSPSGPSSVHPLGVDDLGRDILARVIYGARVSLEVAFISTGIAVFIGVLIGVVAGFFRGWVDTILSRIMDVVLAFPILLLAIGLATACSLGNGCLGGIIQPGRSTLIVVIALSSWPYIGRIIRGQVLSIREKEFVDASRSLGASNSRIMRREILPNLVAPIIVYSSLVLPTNILYEAALSFLGVGVQPPTASWGQMIAAASPIFDSAWWYMLFPGIALVLTVLAFNLVGDGLQDALDPRSNR
ncbi:MAG: peptide/nickel transport system permease protein [Solirubrobacteraceae bacterium]|nr:peptide/nickel transport system permease protein [Solirubrobacteraceae bacterium]